MIECSSKVVDEHMSCYLMMRTGQKDVVDVVQRCGQIDPACRVRACWVVYFFRLPMPVSTILCGKAVRSQAGSDSNHRVALHAEEQ